MNIFIFVFPEIVISTSFADMYGITFKVDHERKKETKHFRTIFTCIKK